MFAMPGLVHSDSLRTQINVLHYKVELKVGQRAERRVSVSAT